MAFFSDDSNQAEAYSEMMSKPQEASWSHELIAGAAAYEASQAYENHCVEQGKPNSRKKAIEIAAGFSGAFVDREIETRGLGDIDRERAKHAAKLQIEEGLSEINEQDLRNKAFKKSMFADGILQLCRTSVIDARVCDEGRMITRELTSDYAGQGVPEGVASLLTEVEGLTWETLHKSTLEE